MRTALLLTALAALVGSCATVGDDGPPALATIDVTDEHGQVMNLAFAVGKVVVIDVCAAWADACLANATAVSRACASTCGDDVEMFTLLLDDGRLARTAALQSYRRVLEVTHPIYFPGPRAARGETALGELSGIPRLVIFDRRGAIVDDISGAVIGEGGLLEKVMALKD